MILAVATPLRADPPSSWVYFGTSGTDASRGIYVSLLDEATGALSPAVRAADKPASVFMAFAPDRKSLYSLATYTEPGSHRALEAVETYAANAHTGALTLVRETTDRGSEGCHISVDPSGRWVLAANYGGAYVETFPVQADTAVGAPSCTVHFSGSGPNALRQATAHSHSINVDPSGRFAIIADLGQDKVFIYRLDAATGALTPNSVPYVSLAPGSGPRHFAFHPDGKFAFVINEMGGSITTFRWDGERGTLTPCSTQTILPADYHGATNTSAEVAVSKDGRFVYGSNRGDDSIVVLAFDSVAGRLSFVQRESDGIKVPRNFAIDPSGRWLVCGNLTADTATVYRIDPDSGRLGLAGSVQVPHPLCVRFLLRR